MLLLYPGKTGNHFIKSYMRWRKRYTLYRRTDALQRIPTLRGRRASGKLFMQGDRNSNPCPHNIHNPTTKETFIMGLTIKGKYPDSPSYDMGAASFFRLRRDIAYTISKEFGQHYAQIPYLHGMDSDEHDRRTAQLIKKYHCSPRLIDFLYQSDIEGRLSPFKCQALLKQINDLHNTSLYGYTAYPEHCMTIEKFKELLHECFTRRTYLIWY